MRPLACYGAALLALASGPAWAAEPIRMTVVAGFGGTLGRAGNWTPVTVDLENGGTSVTGSVVVRYAARGGQGLATEAVELPAAAKKRVTCYVRPRSGLEDLEVSFQDARERVLAGPVRQPLNALDQESLLVGIVSMGSRTDPGLRPLAAEATHLLPLDAEELPTNWAALSSFDALVLREPDVARLGPERIAALETWVAAGGTLVVTASEKWRSFDDPSFTELLPVKVTGVSTLPGTSLPEWLSSPGMLPVVTSERLHGRVLQQTGSGIPLIAEGRFGAGRVGFLAFDLGALPNLPEDSKAALWEALLRLPPPVAANPTSTYYGAPEWLLHEELSHIAPLKPPSVALVGLLVLLYVLAVGPVDYLLLKRLGKLHWTWVTYPVAIGLFSALIYGYARLSHSSDMMVRSVTVVDVPEEPGAPLPAWLFAGIYAPRAGRYRVEGGEPDQLLGSFLVKEEPFTTATTGSRDELSGQGSHPSLTLTIPVWSMGAVEYATRATEAPPFLVGTGAGGAIEVTNTSTRRPLEYVGLLWEGRLLDGGRVEPGRTVKLSPRNRGTALSELPEAVQREIFTPGAEDFPQVAGVIAYATDPPFARDEQQAFGTPPRTRRLGFLERPRADRETPLLLAATSSEPKLTVDGQRLPGTGLTIWRREVRGSGWGQEGEDR